MHTAGKRDLANNVATKIKVWNGCFGDVEVKEIVTEAPQESRGQVPSSPAMV